MGNHWGRWLAAIVLLGYLSHDIYDRHFSASAQARAAGVEVQGREFQFSDYHELTDLYAQYNFAPDGWREHDLKVPRLYLTKIPHRWNDKGGEAVAVHTKKRLFFRALVPLVLRANESILAERERLQSLGDETATLAPADADWLKALALKYRVITTTEQVVDAKAIKTLLSRVDIVPASLALAQGAEESGWGTSRFAADGNALFGQWSWGDVGIEPERQRAALGDYKIARFDSPQDSVSAYMLNLNTHPAYKALRQRRAQLRAAGQPITGAILVEGLQKYSERGMDYVQTLRAIMRINQLASADKAQLLKMAPVYLVPSADDAG